MSHLLQEIIDCIKLEQEKRNEYLMHYGIKRRSGRYPWGSGEHPFQHGEDFLARVQELSNSGMSELEVAKAIGLTTTQLRIQKDLAKTERRNVLRAKARDLLDKGKSYAEVTKELGFNNESSVRNLLNETNDAKKKKVAVVKDYLEDLADKHGFVDVGTGVERRLQISSTKLNEALYIASLEGYETYGGGLQQVTNKQQQTNMKILTKPGTEHKEIYKAMRENKIFLPENDDKIITESPDGSGDKIVKAFRYPESMDSKRMVIRYGDEWDENHKFKGTDKDGVIEIRPGVKDLSLGNDHYSQVRILVDGTHYLKGMAVYADDLPDGIDLRFNTNKPSGTPKEKVLKEIEPGDNPFGSLIKERGGQSEWIDDKGVAHLSLINKRGEEGDWGDWKDTLASQFLAKQPISLIKRQLRLSEEESKNEFDEIMNLTNPTVKKYLLETFANNCDSDAVYLKAAALPRQKFQVILPVPSLKDDQIYAPNFKDGETVALVRYPHGGIFEIPILKVNNKNKEAKSVIGTDSKDAVGINKNVANILSGADFDGDTVMVVPCNSSYSDIKIKNRPPFENLKNFDGKVEYAERPGMRYMKIKDENGRTILDNTQKEMGMITNLIIDMTLKGATDAELEKAVRHSMVVIDAGKHKLDYKRSEVDNDIATLKDKYQGHYNEKGNWVHGASTLISSAKSVEYVTKRKGQPKINQKGKEWYDPAKPEGALIYGQRKINEKGKSWYDPKKPEGSVIYTVIPEIYTDKNGKTQIRTQKSTKMAETDDARKLSSGTAKEELYADYANFKKSLANQARKEMVYIEENRRDSDAAEKYKKEVASLDSKLNLAKLNAPKERQAQLLATQRMEILKRENPDLKDNKEEYKKVSQQQIVQARLDVGAKREEIKITDREWEAIQAHAISSNKLKMILEAADIDKVRKLATPRNEVKLTQGQINRIKALSKQGRTNAEIADALGISVSTVQDKLNN